MPAESKLYYLNARHYDPEIARFMSEDTYKGELNDPLSLNLYTYVSNNPLKYVDPTGHMQKGDEKYKTSNPFVYKQLEFLTELWNEAGGEAPNKEMQKQIHETANYLRSMVDTGSNYAIASLNTFLPIKSGVAPVFNTEFLGDGENREFGANQMSVGTLQYAVVNLEYNSFCS